MPLRFSVITVVTPTRGSWPTPIALAWRSWSAPMHAVRLWETDVTTFDPINAKDLEEESRLDARYTEILSAAKLKLNGPTLALCCAMQFWVKSRRVYQGALDA